MLNDGASTGIDGANNRRRIKQGLNDGAAHFERFSGKLVEYKVSKREKGGTCRGKSGGIGGYPYKGTK